jgi:hypothetical protein
MDSAKTFQILGFVFLLCGVTFLTVGITTKLVALWAMGPAFIGLGVVFWAVSRKRRG